MWHFPTSLICPKNPRMPYISGRREYVDDNALMTRRLPKPLPSASDHTDTSIERVWDTEYSFITLRRVDSKVRTQKDS
jgi:hypothetical protein